MQYLTKVHQRRVRRFQSLYRSVTLQMRRYRDDATNALTVDEIQWLSNLIAGFQERFDNWPTHEIEYLEALYGQNWDTFTVAGHAYLHVSYDLPIVIADSLLGQAASQKALVSTVRASEIYLSLEKGFKDAVHSDWEKPFLVKLFLWRRLEFDTVFLAWLVHLRNGAWIHASQIASSSDSDRSELREALHERVQQKLARALEQTWPWSRIFGLSSPGALTAWGAAAVVGLPLAMGVGALTESVTAIVGGEFVFPFVIRSIFGLFEMFYVQRLMAAFEPPEIGTLTTDRPG